MVIEAVNDQDDCNQDGDGAAEQAENSAVEQAENVAAELAEQAENDAGMANVEVEPQDGDTEESQSVTVKAVVEV